MPGFGTGSEAGAIGEAFGDYLAVTVSEHFAPTADEPCVADWDSTSYTSTVPHCLRRVDGNKHYPEDLVGEVHADGEIWSRALWDIHKALGARLADTIIIRAQFRFTPDISMPAAAAGDDRHGGPVRAAAQRAVAGGVRRARSRVGAHAPLQRQGRPARGGEDRRDHGRQRYRPARVRTDRPTRRRRDERADARLPRLPRVRARAVAQHARGLSLRPAAARGLPAAAAAWTCVDVQHADLSAFLVELATGGEGRPPVAAATLQRKAACLRSFYRHLRREGVIDRDPTADLRAPRKSQRLPQVLSRDEVARLLSAPKGTDPAALRDRALLELMYACGLRASEAIGLDVRDVDLTLGVAARPRQGLQGAPGARSAARRSRAAKAYLERGRPALVGARRRAAPVRQPPRRRPHAPGPLQDRPAPRARASGSRTA